MFEFLGSLVNAATSWFGGEANRNAQQQANQQSWAQTQWMDTHHIQDVVGDAKAAGINPLAALGVSTPSAPVAVGATNDQIGNVGQSLGRAMSALAPQDDKAKQLDIRLKELAVDSAQQDVVAKQLENSKNAVVAQPGTPPGLPARGSNSIPLPTPRPFGGYLGDGALYQTFYDDTGQPIRLLSEKASQSLMNNASIPMSVPIAAQMTGGNIIDMAHQHIRPDVLRHLSPVLGPVDRSKGFWKHLR